MNAAAWIGLLAGPIPVAVALLVLLGRRPPRCVDRVAAVLLALLPLALLFWLNPAFRIYSRHGLFHASILVRIVELGVPPSSPLVAGEPLFYHWAYELVAAAVSVATSLPPSWSFAIVNLVSLTLVIVVLARVSDRLFERRERSLLAPLVAIFAITPVPMWWLKSTAPMSGLAGPLMTRATPVFQKFANTNGVPLGLVCIALSLVALRSPAGAVSRWAGLAATIAACGLLYPPLLPAQLVTVAVFSVVEALIDRSRAPKVIGLDAVASVAGLGFAAAAMALLGMRPVAKGGLFDAAFVGADLVSVLLTAAPSAVLIAVVWRRLSGCADRRLIIQLLAAAAAHAGCFLVVALAERNEYKFLIVSQVLLGLVGGAALAVLRRRSGTLVAGALAVLFLGSFVQIYDNCFRLHRETPIVLDEDGRQLRHPSREQAELYSWISQHTPADAVFIDSEHLVTVLGPRALLIPYRTAAGVRFAEPERGFMHRLDTAPMRLFGISGDLATPRRRLVQGVIDGAPGDRNHWLALAGRIGIDPLFVVCRTPAQHRRLDALGAQSMYVRGEVTVMRWTTTRGENAL